MTSQSIDELFDHVEEFDLLLSTAELHARAEWEETFTSDLRANFQRYGAHTLLSETQHNILERIANE
jgi:hypothetical protein